MSGENDDIIFMEEVVIICIKISQKTLTYTRKYITQI
jgi:hypothetical protein